MGGCERMDTSGYDERGSRNLEGEGGCGCGCEKVDVRRRIGVWV